MPQVDENHIRAKENVGYMTYSELIPSPILLQLAHLLTHDIPDGHRLKVMLINSEQNSLNSGTVTGAAAASAAAVKYSAEPDGDSIGHIKAAACARQGEKERHYVLDHCL